MQLSKKITILADAAKYDVSCASSGSKRARPRNGIGDTSKIGICHSYTPDGRCISLLKILLTNYCIYDCLFCVNRTSSDTPRARFSTEEVVQLTLDFYRRNYIEGLFLSSGIIQSADYTMEQLVLTAKTLRVREQFGGYIHLKTIPDASPELIREAGLYADRLSINIELPKQADLDILAPAKKHAGIESAMNTIKCANDESNNARPIRIRPRRKFAPAGQSTQIIVGATISSDAEILAKSSALYKEHRLRRVYYSAFSPIPFSAPGVPVVAAPLVREHRLYQADWLFRFYGFSHNELVPSDTPNLPLDIDPKFAWALRNRHLFPVDINRASREMLLRVPGLGVRSVDRIIKSRRFGPVRLHDLMRLRVPLDRIKYFVLTSDNNPNASLVDSLLISRKGSTPQVQLSLFNVDARAGVVSGEL